MANEDFSTEQEEAWVARERDKVAAYLGKERIVHLGIGEWPAFHVQPYLAVWAVQSKKSPGSVGWWAISGDVPTDYMSSADAPHPREAMAHFAREWNEVSDYMARGVSHPESRIARDADWTLLSPLLKSRGEILARFAADPSIWCDE